MTDQQNKVNTQNNTLAPISPVSLIVGCGYVGKVLATKLLALGQMVYATTRSQDRLPELAALGAQPLIVDITQPLTFAALRPIFEAGNPIDLYCLITPGRPNREPGPYATAVEGVKSLISYLDHQRGSNDQPLIRKAVMTSSTGVYPYQDGRKVSADDIVQPEELKENPRSQLLYQSEQTFQSASWPSCVVRLAGIYGPGRVIGKRGIRDGAPIAGNPNAILNLIYRDDAADLLIAAAASGQTAAIELGSDNYPAPRIDYYKEVAKYIPSAPTTISTEADTAITPEEKARLNQRASSKRCDNTPTCQRTDWTPKFPSFHEGLKQIFEAEQESLMD